jgi:hypothetical protein
MSTFIELASRQVARFLPFRRVAPSTVSPVWPSAPFTTSASSAASAAPPRRRSFAEIVARSRAAPARPIAPPDRAPAVTGAAVVTPRPPAVIGAAEGTFGTPLRPRAPVRLAASRPAPAVHSPRPPPRDFSHLAGNTVQPVDKPRLPEKPDSRYSAMWAMAFKLATTGERPPPPQGDRQISRMWAAAFRKVLREGGQR